MSRSSKKRPYVFERLLDKVNKAAGEGRKEAVKTWSRRSVVYPEFVGHVFLVHNGKTFNKVFITEDMVGHKLGEFSLTRTFRSHSGTKKAAAK